MCTVVIPGKVKHVCTLLSSASSGHSLAEPLKQVDLIQPHSIYRHQFESVQLKQHFQCLTVNGLDLMSKSFKAGGLGVKEIQASKWNYSRSHVIEPIHLTNKRIQSEVDLGTISLR